MQVPRRFVHLHHIKINTRTYIINTYTYIMAESGKTHWKKNIDSNYICGEDMKSSLRGLQPQMDVYLVGFGDGETYDQNQNKKIIKTVLRFKTIDGDVLLKKGVLLNKSAAEIFIVICGSDYVDDWIGIPVCMYAKPDNRFGHVVRFKNYRAPTEIRDALKPLRACKTIEELGAAYKKLSETEQNNKAIKYEVNKLKNGFNN